MTISRTYGNLQAQIADEMGDRQDLLAALSDSSDPQSPIVNAINQAIAKWERERFYFNQLLIDPTLTVASPWNTVIGQEYYTAADYANIPLLAKIDKLWVLVNANRYPIEWRGMQYMVDVSVNPAITGQPTEAAYVNEQVKFYPIPNGAYPIGLLGTLRQPAFSSGSSTSVWTQDAYDLIRSEAKYILATEVTRDPDIAEAAERAIYGDPMRPEVRGYLAALKRETTRRQAGARVRPTHF